MLDSLNTQILDFLDIGGPVVMIHILMSVLLVTIGLVKLWQFGAAGLFSMGAGARAERVVKQWETGDLDGAVDEARAGRDPQNRLLFHAADYLHRGTLTEKALDDELLRMANRDLHRLRSHLPTVDIIAALAPLLGLLGTVLGMIEAFQAMESAGRQVDPSVLSAGIWKALLTTAVGLVVAVPAIIMHNWLDRRIDNYAALLGDRTNRILTAARKQQAGPSVAAPLELSRARA